MPKPLLVPGRTVWRVERCSRAAVLIDGSSCFGAMRAAFLAARRTIYVVGWDIDSRTELVGAAPPSDGLPTAFGPFLVELLARKPELRVHLLLWDYSLVYAYEREKLPRLHLDWEMPPQVSFRLDNTVAFGSSQHQKLVIVDDTLAFSGGLDLTIRRWDTPDHEVDQPARVDPDGKPYNPFHDVQMMVDGKAGQALAVLAHERWCRAGDEGEAAIAPEGDPWPDDIVPDFRDVEIAISRTQPRFRNEEPAYEVERLFLELARMRRANDLHREPVHDIGALRRPVGGMPARQSFARGRHRGAARARIPAREPHHAQRPDPLLADRARRRRRARASRLAGCDAGRAEAST